MSEEYPNITIEEFKERFPNFFKTTKPKKVYYKDGHYIAGEEIRKGDLVYLGGERE